ncbi:MAG: RNA polymerase sigma factor [Candidatus Peribacteraceae bacterium]|nr:RNA polymerase sigma factor [Candidatus Peribacteraceae bacterium]
MSSPTPPPAKPFHPADFESAYEQYSDAIFRHCYFRVFNRERGKELMQEAFMKAWEYIAKGNQVDNIRAFLYRIANNLIVDEFRKKDKQSVSLEDLQEKGWEPGYDSLPDIQSAIDEKYVLETLNKVEKKYREVLIMRYVDHLSPAEIAAITHETANVISVRIHRGIKQLKSFLAPR